MTARFCIRCGRRVRRHREHGHWRWRCPACGWTYYGNPAAATGAVVIRGSRVLLVRRARPPWAGTWDLPGGFIEADESPEAGLRRELREELGVGARDLRFIGFSVDRYGPRGMPILGLIFRVKLDREPVKATDDVSEVRWFERNAIPWREIAFPGLRKLLRRCLIE